ncbi:ferredoxin--NADP(+) reductase [Candidatus Endobugula sertula]|uniref:Ferredoxin--NADP(+) reductase n=1 Tax=Candidatus Endobugula sertula TaxID=62101 RepID=A0A1D2QRE1_9GAMM|nr:ferredoxin--NADP(+) reductase [Candidatus Endobugula sertula]
MSIGAETIAVTVTDIVTVNELVTRFKFKRTDGKLLPAFSGGAHIVVEMQHGDQQRRNPYSLMSSPFDLSYYSISIRRDDKGRGGSLFMHQEVGIGDEMTISYPVNVFSLDMRAKKYLMIAGGIGITPFLAQIPQISCLHGHFELHYSVRSSALGSYVGYLTAQYPNNVHTYYSDHKQYLDLDKLLTKQPLGTHLYICGPKGMIEWVCKTAAKYGWPRETVHYEEFLTPRSGKPFQVTLAVSNKTIEVSANQSLLEAMESAGVEAPYLCRGGVCGQCETDVCSSEGHFIHNDHWLNDEQRASGKKMMPCVSRFEGKSLVIDR